MPIVITTSRIIKNTFQHLVRNPWYTFVAVAVMSLTFFVTSVFVLLAFGSNVVLQYFENKPQVTAFFKDQTPEDYILQLKTQLEQTGKASNVKYISKNDALNIYRKQNANEPQLLEFVTADILPASLEISATKLDYLNDLATQLKADSNIEKVLYQSDVVNSLKNWSDRIRIGGAILVGFLAFVSVLIVLVVISMNIAGSGREIEIMRLVGASSGYVRWPFLLDGAIYGFISATLSTLLLLLILPKLIQYSSDLIRGINILPQTPLFILELWGVMVICGVILGMVGSLAAIRRHLKV